MDINLERKGETLTLFLNGKLDTQTAPLLDEKLKEEMPGVKHLVFDLKGLDYVSSAGLRTFLSTHKQLAGMNGDMTVRNVNEDVSAIFDVTGFSDFLKIL
ncbi:MAG: STAS domain-containing protein [Lachnospiraceae bacterium]|nr:STAS domain-containing protein [Lachnospiraceae bacterium]